MHTHKDQVLPVGLRVGVRQKREVKNKREK
jgi:hypothetical protein